VSRGTWVPLYGNVFTHPKVTSAARRLTRGDCEKLVGHLARLWTWAIDHAETGDLSHLRARAIATAAGWTGDEHRFVKVLLAVGLFDAGPRIHEFSDYAGRLAERRKRDRERKAAGEKAQEQATTPKTSAGIPAVDDRTRQDSDSFMTTTSFARAVSGTGATVADGSRSSDGTGRSEEADGATVERALEVLRRVRWYPFNVALDAPLLREAAARAPRQDLGADVQRWAEKAQGGRDVRRPRGALTKWLAKFGDQDRPIDPTTHPLAAEEKAAQERWERERTGEAYRALQRARGIA